MAQTIPLAESWGMHDLGTGWWIVMMVGMVLFWAAIILAIAWLISRGAARGRLTAEERVLTKESPTEVLERRFAEGEISIEDYHERREVLINGAAESNGAHKDKTLTVPSARERSE